MCSWCQHWGKALAFASAILLFFANTAGAVPSGGYASWTEVPWIKPADASQDDGLPESPETTLSDPVYFNLSGNEPESIRLGDRKINYSDYACGTAGAPLFSEIWISKDSVWSRYGEVTAGEAVDLIIRTARESSGDIYLVSYAKNTTIHWNFKFLAGCYRLRLQPEESGRLFMLLSQETEPGNALILDVLPRQSEKSFSPLDVNSIAIGEAFITIRSQRLRGYDVFVNGVFFCNDNSDGSLDGVASLTIGGGKTHTITISQRDGRGGIINKSEHTRSFARDTHYTLQMD
ncbi:MAG: hypothetical protein A4E49_01717 [Methanosaeta sp. PtaU1.Bin112]|nr:MAG: hypothetical protein A4E49_01717 [Methanosaeta sp. PtaU1.Bin112]